MFAYKNYLKLLLFTAAASAMVLLYYFFDARDANSFFPHCPFNTLTGLYCPGCGSQRAISALLHGDVMSALKFNVLTVIFIPFLLYASVVFCINTFSKNQMHQRIFYSPLFAKLILCFVMLFWVLRNIPVYPFRLLAPGV